MFLKKIMRSASPLFRKLQKLLDRMSTVLLENITGVRVVRAFNKEAHEQNRLNTSFSGYADTSIKANRMFASLDGLSFFTVNVFVILVYSFSGFRVTAGAFAVADLAAIIEYAMLALFYLMMAQMVILTLPRAFECADRVRTVLEFSPTIQDLTQKKVWFPAPRPCRPISKRSIPICRFRRVYIKKSEFFLPPRRDDGNHRRYRQRKINGRIPHTAL